MQENAVGIRNPDFDGSRRRPRREMPASQGESDLPPVGEGSDDGLGDSTAHDAPKNGKGNGQAPKGEDAAHKQTA